MTTRAKNYKPTFFNSYSHAKFYEKREKDLQPNDVIQLNLRNLIEEEFGGRRSCLRECPDVADHEGRKRQLRIPEEPDLILLYSDFWSLQKPIVDVDAKFRWAGRKSCW